MSKFWKRVGKLERAHPGRKVLGLDPSMTGYGVALIDDQDVWCGEAKFPPGPDRGNQIYTMVRHMIRAAREGLELEAICFEGMVGSMPNSALVSGQVNAWTTLAIRHELGMNSDVEVFHASPGTMKKVVTGKGTAEKDHTLLALHTRYGLDFSEHSNNGADATGHAIVAAAMMDAIDIPSKCVLDRKKVETFFAEYTPKPKKGRRS